MRSITRRKLSMVGKALDFARANPSTNAGYVATTAKLAERLARADALAVQENDGYAAERSAIAKRRRLRRQIHLLLRHLVTVAHVASHDSPDLDGVFQIPLTVGPNRGFLAAAKTLLAAAETHLAALEAAGIGDTFIADLTAAVTEFEETTSAAHAGRRERVGAVADLPEVAAECVSLVAVLGGLVRLQFANDAERLRAWQSAANVFGPFTRKAEPVTPEAPVVVLPTPVPPGTAVQVM